MFQLETPILELMLRGAFLFVLFMTLFRLLPRPEGLPFTADAKRLAYLYARARNRYKDVPQLGKDVGAKVRRLIDEHVISLGIDPKIPPIQLTDAEFDERDECNYVQEKAIDAQYCEPECVDEYFARKEAQGD